MILAPGEDTVLVEGSVLIINDKRSDTESQTFFHHNQADDVSELKRAQVGRNVTPVPIVCEDDNVEQEVGESTVAYKKMTDEMIDICFKCGKKVANGENVQELADDIAESTGMNRSSAVMYLYAVQGMLSGTIYKRAISAKALKKYFDTIWNEYGSQGLKKAIQATRLHVDYRGSCGHMVDSIEEICDQYERRL